MRHILLTLALCAGCTSQTTRHLNRAGLAISAASLAVDWCQTRDAAGRGWSGGYEGGMPTAYAIGSRPPTGAVDAYFALGGALLLGGAQLLPERWRPIAYAAVAAVEISTVRGNLETTRCLGVGR
jgi:hypothetical protein